MRTATLSVLLAAGAALAGAAYAQEAPSAPPAYEPTTPFSAQSDAGPPNWDGDAWRRDPGLMMPPRPLEAGVAALEANDFTRAEKIFNEGLRYYGSNPRYRFFMGVAKMNLGKWEEARRYLRTAARELRKLPDPKGHLGVTYAKLGDIESANAQRARLVEMAEACKGTCKLSPYIASGIQMIDEALAETPSSAS
jgi:tetratricopeptide (TPR) repeat protein